MPEELRRMNDYDKFKLQWLIDHGITLKACFTERKVNNEGFL
jgi:hypothetical protein